MHTRTNLSALALKHGTLTLFFMLVLVAAGVLAYFNLGRAEDPPFTIKQMVVSAAWPGATSREMELQVTDKLETKLQELPYFYNVQSYTKPGETVIYVSLRDDIPPAKVPDLWYQVRKKIGDIRGSLPQGVLGPNFNDEYGDTYALIWAFESDGFSDAEMKAIVKEARLRLLRMPDVTKVDLFGVQVLGTALDTAMAEIERNLPLGITIHRVANQPEVVDESVREFTRSLAEALGIVLVVSFISLGFRTGIIVALSVPLVLAITFV